MRNHPITNPEVMPPKDGVLLHFDKHDADIERNWSKTIPNKDPAKP